MDCVKERVNMGADLTIGSEYHPQWNALQWAIWSQEGSEVHIFLQSLDSSEPPKKKKQRVDLEAEVEVLTMTIDGKQAGHSRVPF